MTCKLIVLWTLKRQAKNIFTYITYSTFSEANMKKTVIAVVTQNNAFPIKTESIFLEKHLI